jgi:hypothetical protein
LGTRDWNLMHYSNPSLTGGQKHTHCCHCLAALTSLLLNTLIAIAIALIVAHNSCCCRPIALVLDRPPSLLTSPWLLPPLPLPSLKLANLVAIAIAFFVACDSTPMPPLLLLCCHLGGGEGRTIPIQCTIQLRPLPPELPSLSLPSPLPPLPPAQPARKAGLTMRGISLTSRQLTTMQQGCCQHLWSRGHPPC